MMPHDLHIPKSTNHYTSESLSKILDGFGKNVFQIIAATLLLVFIMLR